MRTVWLITQKEFIQVFRNKQMLPMIFVMPIIQLVLLVYAATMEIKNADFCAVDKDRSESSRRLIAKFANSKFFTLEDVSPTEEAAFEKIARNEAKLVIIIPQNFESDMIREQNAEIQFVINAEDGSAAGLVQAYAAQTAMSFARNVMIEFLAFTPTAQPIPQIKTSERYWYNIELDYKQYMAPGILVILITFIGMFLAGMNVVKEKEIGTIEQLNATPIKRWQFILGKLTPFWLIGLFELAFGLLLIKIIFDVPFLGNLLLLFGFVAIYLIVVLGAALLISTITETQQQAMFVSWFFVVVFILMSGLFTPIESMPDWARTVALFNPVAHFVEIIRRILLKGAGFFEVKTQFAYLTAMALAMITLSVWRYRKTTN